METGKQAILWGAHQERFGLYSPDLHNGSAEDPHRSKHPGEELFLQGNSLDFSFALVSLVPFMSAKLMPTKQNKL